MFHTPKPCSQVPANSIHTKMRIDEIVKVGPKLNLFLFYIYIYIYETYEQVGIVVSKIRNLGGDYRDVKYRYI